MTEGAEDLLAHRRVFVRSEVSHSLVHHDTDGIVEALNAENEEFGEERLLKVVQENSGLALQELLRDIVQSVRSYAEQSSIGDDVCLLAATYYG